MNAYLDSDPAERRQLVVDRAAAKDLVTRLNAAIKAETDLGMPLPDPPEAR